MALNLSAIIRIQPNYAPRKKEGLKLKSSLSTEISLDTKDSSQNQYSPQKKKKASQDNGKKDSEA